jgi:nitrogen fixation NifU-like protein
MTDRDAAIGLLLDHYEHPRHRGRLEEADVRLRGGNEHCGDILEVSLRLEDGVVAALAFEGSGCTVSQASASVLAEWAAGRRREEVEALDEQRMIDMLGRDVVESRPLCATLALNTLQTALKRLDDGHRSAAPATVVDATGGGPAPGGATAS